MNDPSLKTWYLARDGQQHGPLTLAEVQAAFRGGHVLPNDYVWEPDANAWIGASEVFSRFSAVPPPPSTPQRSGVAPVHTSGPSFNVGAAARFARIAGFTGIVLSIVAVVVTMLGMPAPLLHFQCLYTSSYYWIGCPLGGNLHVLFGISVGLLLLGAFLSAAGKRPPP